MPFGLAAHNFGATSSKGKDYTCLTPTELGHLVHFHCFHRLICQLNTISKRNISKNEENHLKERKQDGMVQAWVGQKLINVTF
jgi:hypothetical protein